MEQLIKDIFGFNLNKMKKLEIILGCMFLLGNIMKIWSISGYFVLIKFSSMLLCLLYFFFSYILLNPVKIRDSNTYSVGVYRTLVSIFFGWALCTFVFGVYSIVTYLLSGWIFSIIGLMLLIFCCVFLLFGIQRHKKFVLKCFRRISIVICISFIALIIRYLAHQ